MTLTLVRPSTDGQDGGETPAVRRRRVPVLSLTSDESARLRATIRNLARAYGTLRCVAEVMGVSEDALSQIANGKSNGSPGMLLRAARAACTTVDRLLAPLASVAVCPTCGARKGAS